VADKSLDESADLRYLGAESVRCAAGNLSDFRVCTGDAQSLGSIEGVLISPSSRRLEFFVIESPGRILRRKYLLPIEAGPFVQQGPNTLRVAATKDELHLQMYAPRSIPEFSDDDLMKTLFASDAA
jgi:hypothetical protein